jgi:hypothetical protein
MSKFIERLKHVSQPPPPPLGFGRRKTEPTRPKIQVLVFLGDKLTDSPASADAIVFPEVKTGVEDIPGGVLLKKGEPGDIDKLVEAGMDFVILPSDGDVIRGKKKIGKILLVNPGVTDYLLRSVSDLPVDAVTVATSKEEDKKLTWERLMLCHRFAGLITKPVLVPVPLDATADELQMVWDTGVSGIVIDVKTASDATALTNLRENVDSLKYPAKRNFERLSPVLPHIHEVAEDEPDDEEED